MRLTVDLHYDKTCGDIYFFHGYKKYYIVGNIYDENMIKDKTQVIRDLIDYYEKRSK